MTTFEYARVRLRLARPTRSASGSVPTQQRLVIRARSGERDGSFGLGEAAPHPVHGPPLEAILDSIRAAASGRDPVLAPCPAFSGCIADLQARQAGLPLWRHLSLPPPPRVVASVMTYGGIDPDEVVAQIAHEQPPAVKLKMTGHASDFDVLHAIVAATTIPIALDWNGSRTPADARRDLQRIERVEDRILWIEQPCPPHEMPARLPTDVPIFADEAVAEGDFDPARYQGVVLKPARDGLDRCLEIARLAARNGLDVTLGCHLQTAITTATTFALSGLVTTRWVDLDTVFFAMDDPFAFALASEVATRSILAPSGAGIGIDPPAEMAWSPL